MSSLYNYLIFVLLLKETCFKRLQESYKYSLKLDRHQGFFLSVSTKELHQIKYTCVLLPHEVKKLVPPLSLQMILLSFEIAFKILTAEKRRRSNLTVNFQDIKKRYFREKVTGEDLILDICSLKLMQQQEPMIESSMHCP